MGIVQQFGKNVRRVREEKGWPQDELAVKAGLTRSYVSDLERGVRNPSVAALGQLADALGVEPWELLHPALSTPI